MVRINPPRIGRASAIERFWNGVIVDLNTECWDWIRHCRDGYGRLYVEGLHVQTHRFAYSFFRGPIPHGYQLDHLCENRTCCNPWHLDPVRQSENIRRSPITLATLNSRKTHCKHGHEFTEENTIYRRDRKGRQCRTCDGLHQKSRCKSALSRAEIERSMTHCKRGHEYSEENTYLWKTSRHCRKCRCHNYAARTRTSSSINVD
jgi:HNH endonuclease